MLFSYLWSKASRKGLSGFVEDEPTTVKELFKEGEEEPFCKQLQYI